MMKLIYTNKMGTVTHSHASKDYKDNIDVFETALREVANHQIEDDTIGSWVVEVYKNGHKISVIDFCNSDLSTI